MFGFNSVIINSDVIQKSFLWQAAESYLNIGQKAYRVVKLEGKKAKIKAAESKSSLIALKIISYITIIPLVLAMGVREWYRRSYQLTEVINLPKEGETTDHRITKTAYKVEEVLAKLQQAQQEGLKLGLFIGRQATQSIPQEKGWAWCSLDIEPVDEVLKGRLHLQMDFNNEENIRTIQELFDKVVCDFSVIKFFDNNPWHTLKSFLVNKPDAELIAESWCGNHGISMDRTVAYDPENATMITPIEDELDFQRTQNLAFQAWKQREGERQAERLYQSYLSKMPKDQKEQLLYSHHGADTGLRSEFMRHILKEHHLEPKRIDRLPGLLVEIKKYLLGLFQEVELKYGSYPYRQGDEKIETDYWVARNPKMR